MCFVGGGAPSTAPTASAPLVEVGLVAVSPDAAPLVEARSVAALAGAAPLAEAGSVADSPGAAPLVEVRPVAGSPGAAPLPATLAGVAAPPTPATLAGVADTRCGFHPRKRKALVTTHTELTLMAAAAIIGFRLKPAHANAPAATGMQMAL